MDFLDGPAARNLIWKQSQESCQKRFAVAFWGDGAAERLGLDKSPEGTRIICNLLSGGTNPAEIKKLMNLHVEVRHSSTLHAKVYLFPDNAVVGSSNASANGLALEGDECSGWSEANLFTDAPNVLTVLDDWFESYWVKAEPVTDEALELAKQIRRRTRSKLPPSDVLADDLLEALGKAPGDFKEKNQYLLIFRYPLDADQIEVLEEVREHHGDNLDIAAFDWEGLPRDSVLVSFWMGPRGGVAFDGIFHIPRIQWEVPAGDSTLQLCVRVEGQVEDLDYPWGTKEKWRQVLLKLKEAGELDPDDGTLLMDLGEFGERYVKPWFDAQSK